MGLSASPSCRAVARIHGRRAGDAVRLRRRDAGPRGRPDTAASWRPELREDYASDANAYVRLAERVNGPIPRPAGFSWPWGDALPVLEEAAPDVRVINLETSITRSADFAPGKAVHYRMNPDNLPCNVSHYIPSRSRGYRPIEAKVPGTSGLQSPTDAPGARYVRD